MATKSKKKRKVLRRGRDWHGWVLKMPGVGLCFWAEPVRPQSAINCGKWVKVKFVEVEGD